MEKEFAKLIKEWIEGNDKRILECRLDAVLNGVTRPIRKAAIKIVLSNMSVDDLYQLCKRHGV